MTAAVPVSRQADAGGVGLTYSSPLPVTEPLLAGLCDDCGAVVRLWVKYPKRQWMK